ncbi:MAG: lamin tail domain-containing protein, partial [Candidatus Binatia bacterium]
RVRIEMSLDGGASWRTLFKKTANDGEQTWKIKKRTATAQALVRIRSVSDPSLSDTSDAVFIIQ